MIKNDWNENNCDNEVKELRTYVEEQIKKNWDKRGILDNGESKSIATFMTHADTRWGNKAKVFSKTAANIIVNELKESGFFVWFSSAVYDEENYWVTARPERPHCWFHKI